MKNFRCMGCHKMFDFDKYYGICPKCGTFNQKREEAEELHQEMHKQYDSFNMHKEKTPSYASRYQTKEEHEEKKNRFPLYVFLFCFLVTIIVFISVIIGRMKINKFIDTANYEVVTVQPGEVIALTDGNYKIERAVEIVPANREAGLPIDEKMIGVRVSFEPKLEEGKTHASFNIKSPYIEYLDGFHKNPLYFRDTFPYISKYGLEEKDLLNNYQTFYAGTVEANDLGGYYIYLVDNDAKNITVTLELKKEYKNLQITSGAYQMTLPIEGREENADE